eukprot:1140464-Pelagomonas_calceolata.AAC.3
MHECLTASSAVSCRQRAQNASVPYCIICCLMQAAHAAGSATAAPPAPKSSTSAPAQQKIDVFISFRVKEAQTETSLVFQACYFAPFKPPQAIALKRALEAENFHTFCSAVDIPEGADCQPFIITMLIECQ